MGTRLRSALFAGAALAVLGLAAQAAAEPVVPKPCPLATAAVKTVCAALPDGTDFFNAGTIGASTSGDSPGLCVCPPTTIKECNPHARKPDSCASGQAFQGLDVITESTTGKGTCTTVCKTIGGSRRCFELCQ